MTEPKKKSETDSSQTIDYGIFGSFKVVHIEKTLFNELELEIYSKVAPDDP
jgi:hypothetical protein